MATENSKIKAAVYARVSTVNGGHNPHTYRVIYRGLENQKQVEVLHIRHGARRKLKTPDLA